MTGEKDIRDTRLIDNINAKKLEERVYGHGKKAQ